MAVGPAEDPEYIAKGETKQNPPQVYITKISLSVIVSYQLVGSEVWDNTLTLCEFSEQLDDKVEVMDEICVYQMGFVPCNKSCGRRYYCSMGSNIYAYVY